MGDRRPNRNRGYTRTPLAVRLPALHKPCHRRRCRHTPRLIDASRADVPDRAAVPRSFRASSLRWFFGDPKENVPKSLKYRLLARS